MCLGMQSLELNFVSGLLPGINGHDESMIFTRYKFCWLIIQ
jgi:hypothetical protein